MPSTDEILKRKYPAKAHLQHVSEYLKGSPSGVGDCGVIYLEAAKSKLWPNSDQEAPLRQDRFFYYLTGCELPDCHVVYDISKKQSTLFIPPIVDEAVVWSGLPLSPEEALRK